MKQTVEHGADRLRAGGQRVSFLDLSEDLRLADDQRVEARRDAEQVARRVEVRHVVQMRREHRPIDTVKFRP